MEEECVKESGRQDYQRVKQGGNGKYECPNERKVRNG